MTLSSSKRHYSAYALQAAEIDQKMAEIQARIGGTHASPPAQVTRPAKRVMSVAARRRIAEAQRKRWAAFRKEAKATTPGEKGCRGETCYQEAPNEPCGQETDRGGQPEAVGGVPSCENSGSEEEGPGKEAASEEVGAEKENSSGPTSDRAAIERNESFRKRVSDSIATGDRRFLGRFSISHLRTPGGI
jgi:hypothetical protein